MASMLPAEPTMWPISLLVDEMWRDFAASPNTLLIMAVSAVSFALAMKRAFEDAGMKPSDIQYYNAHGTSTSANDTAETAMIKSVFGDDAKKLHISSTKSEIGHMVGAAGAIEAIMCIKAMEDNFVPPTINLDEPDLEHGCDLDYTPNKGVACEIKATASCSLGFGGHNGCIILKAL